MRELVYTQPSPRRVRKKPGPVAKARAKRRRVDDAVRLEIRRRCVLRDGYCKISMIGGCDGNSEHAHIGEKKRARTRGLPPHERHTMEDSAMLCTSHHKAYDSGRLQIHTFQELGANGPVRVAYRGQVYMINS